MTVLRQRHKNMIIAGVIGFLFALVCVVLVYIFGFLNNPKAIQWLVKGQTEYSAEENQEEEAPQIILEKAYVFTKALKENDIVVAEDFSETMMDQTLLPDQRILNPEELIGKKIKCDSSLNMIATKTMVYEEKRREEVKESIEMLDIQVPEFIQDAEQINVRIHYPTGQDFLVLENVLLTKIYEERQGATLQLNHNEIVSLSSAKEDVNIYPGTRLYYTKDTQRYTREYIGEQLRNQYPVNPNTIGFLTSSYNDEEVYKERVLLDETLNTFFDQESKAYSFTHIEKTIQDAKENQEVLDGVDEGSDSQVSEESIDMERTNTEDTIGQEVINVQTNGTSPAQTNEASPAQSIGF